MDGQEAIEELIAQMARLPGLGPRSARRAVLHLVKKRDARLVPLARLLTEVGQSVRPCLNCGNIATADICGICAAGDRANGQICVVEDVADLWAMERAQVFKGRYHVLGGTLSPLDDVGPDDLAIPKLRDRISAEAVTEVILALNATVDGQTTAHYVARELEATGVQVFGLARGMPVGGELDYMDDGTLRAALSQRQPI
ncbi:recombination mediator RecR [Jannaschia seohaensis]|uniref:Recombination protein RecR n=1 Tax=Jannaschia seohaensis TaxID=475081 RepID=A0A2Y9B6S6_9RHOB|nr:recombination mediator RecR [Jannaschia seohaensis]PWJ12095.1 DNA replication and repair protein RecR [Jannaschia seohaensis]SSA51198.1 DNA replication and repair protein RecR [Jannaschia seohaensis]